MKNVHAYFLELSQPQQDPQASLFEQAAEQFAMEAVEAGVQNLNDFEMPVSEIGNASELQDKLNELETQVGLTIKDDKIMTVDRFSIVASTATQQANPEGELVPQTNPPVDVTEHAEVNPVEPPRDPLS